MTTVSVGMSVYNGEKYLPQKIDSILNQLHQDDELVISYDQSTDRTKEIIDDYAARDSRVKVYENTVTGIVGNFNNALSHCRNDVIFISDQDDVWVEGKRDIMVRALEQSGADLAIHNTVHIDGTGKTISEPLFQKYGISKGLLRTFAMPRYSGCCMAFTRETKRMILPMPASVINYDHWVGMVCELYGHVAFVNDVLLLHRLHGENVTTSRRALPVVLRQRWNLTRALLSRRKEMRR